MTHIRDAVTTGSNIRGIDHDASISLILDNSPPGHGPRLHRHPYDETWVIHDGSIVFELDGEQIQAGPGDVVIAPAGAAHKFISQGPGRCSLVCIHASPTFQTEWLEPER
jgi:mannose-6-phosphate isomerase-like protein (cupin superfamily)